MIEVQSESPFVSFAVLALVIFFLTPSRFLHLGHCVLASLIAAFVFGSHALDAYFWGSLLSGAVLGGAWLFRRLSAAPVGTGGTDSDAGTEETS